MLRSGFLGVFDEIAEHQLQVQRIYENGGVFKGTNMRRNVADAEMRHHFVSFVKSFSNGNRFELSLLLGVLTHALNDVACACCIRRHAVQDVEHFFFADGVVAHHLFKTFGVKAYGGQRLPQFMCNETGNLPDGPHFLQTFHFLPLSKLQTD